MLTHCDFVYAGESAKFQIPFVNLGLVPEFGSSFSLPARVGHLRAAELFLLGEPFNAVRAAELGLVTRVVPDERSARDRYRNGAEARGKSRPARCGPQSGSSSRRRSDQLRDGVKVESREFSERLRSAEAKEAFTAFRREAATEFPNLAKPVAAE